MKYLLLFIATIAVNPFLFAQKITTLHATKQLFEASELNTVKANTGLTAYRQTSYGDTVYMSHIAPTDTITLYHAANDSGYIAGIDAYGDKGFAERYDFSGVDSTVKVIGVIPRFGGHVNPLSSKSVTFTIWSPAQKTVSTRATLFNSGFPGTVLTTKTVKLTELGVATIDTATDTAKLFMFPVPTPYLASHFFIGYTMTYTWGNQLQGDTIGLYSNLNGERTMPSFTAYSVEDTTINNLNVTQYTDNSWHDNAVDNFAISNNLYVFPVVIVAPGVTGVNGINRNGFIFYGNYPEPANNTTNIKISLPASTDVTIELMDMNGTVIRTIKEKVLSAGEHIMSIETSSLPAGDYVYFIRTTAGDGIASKITIVR